MMSLNKYKLADIAKIEISGVDKKTIEGEIPVRLCNFVDVYYNWAITKEKAKSFMVASAKQTEIDKYSIGKGMVAITKDSETRDDIGVATYIADDFENVVLGYHCALITPNPAVVDGKYLNAFMHTRYIQKYFENNASGSGQRYTLSNDTIGNIPVLLPSIDEQHTIRKVLADIDRKIELNKQINDNLEQQTQALFKSWFVDNPKPNWSETTFSEVANFIGGYSYKGEELTDSSNIAMVTIKNFGRNGGFKADGFKGIAPFVKLKECHYANLFDILVAHTDLTQNADVIGNAELLLTYGRYDGIIFSMDLVKVLPKNNFPYRFLLAAMLKNKIFKGHCLGYVNGTTVLHLSKKALPNFEVKIPPKAEAKTMNDALAPYYQRMAEVLQENDRLIHLRDTLLPKLMSGELNINAKSRLQ
ncbi:restriction endonuclease subunit S [Bacteroides ovatus]|uniref:restriction endonuclease subunit S n=1 Tax=Bacteroides ovatus TaxID=28116 RepID=UPI0021658181|nr:restriction endonuclease subunit S [Bacteroides ovatus]MCS3033912.1 restriction endonuclease subunit S [Bacteroides ovatus]